MNSTPHCSSLLLICLLSCGSSVSAAETKWETISDSGEVRKLIVGKALLMYKTRTHFYRRDGNMIEHFPSNNGFLVRKWTIEKDARICWRIFTLPDRVIDCAAIHRTTSKPIRYRYKWTIVRAWTSPVEFVSGPSKKLLEALNKKAGPIR